MIKRSHFPGLLDRGPSKRQALLLMTLRHQHNVLLPSIRTNNYRVAQCNNHEAYPTTTAPASRALIGESQCCRIVGTFLFTLFGRESCANDELPCSSEKYFVLSPSRINKSPC